MTEQELKAKLEAIDLAILKDALSDDDQLKGTGYEELLTRVLARLEAAECERDEAEACCAKMRESLENVLEVADLIDDKFGHQSKHIKHALSSDCGKDFVRKSKLGIG